ncbi:hypothetical protein KSF_072890 [Reticulibacter mediterranei]|uniref:Uncharacterized protein n=1 Tax=Reticulibacter mediterranei TaxID=2778369 RepID=A0A8J3IMD0_9CHLR|nr:hypothetical protein [Reticulibacter mediterranei]GHO97241.1 hypothetical protein KSF_072890 [Reticulibacter mediterranei]
MYQPEEKQPLTQPKQPHPKTHRRRRDAGKGRFTKRDCFALIWIGHQYGIRLDHLQLLLGRFPGRGATYTNWISGSATRDVVTRWEKEGLVRVERLEVDGPFWIWLTPKGLRRMGLSYTYRDLRKLKDVKGEDLTHLYAINAIRLDIEADEPEAHWISERALRQGQIRLKGQTLLHRPDGVVVFPDGKTVAIEAELSMKKPFELEEVLLELLWGEAYLRRKTEYDRQTAREFSRGNRSPYDQIWYFAPKTIRRHVRRARERLFADLTISQQEAERIYIAWYPLPHSDEESTQEEREDNEALGLDDEDEEEERLDAEGEGDRER